MDEQDRLLREIRDSITTHLAVDKEVKPAIDELITLYKGSKVLIPMMVTAAVALWAFWEWARAHIK
jgi:hypothetical protein